MLIDAGNNDDSKLIEDYLRDQGVEKLQYVIGTHPHEDHIGSLDTVINKFNIGNEKGDLNWGKSNIWNNTKSDIGKLYNSSGTLVFTYDD